MITLRERKEGRVLDGFAVYGHKDGVVIKYLGEEEMVTGAFDFSEGIAMNSLEKGYDGDIEDGKDLGEKDMGKERGNDVSYEDGQ